MPVGVYMERECAWKTASEIDREFLCVAAQEVKLVWGELFVFEPWVEHVGRF